MRNCDLQEKRVCKILGGRRQIGSGSTPFLKGDGVLDDLLIECKTRDKVSKSISIKKDWFDKVREEAFSMGKEGSILVFSFGDGRDFVVEDIEDFKEHYRGYKKVLDIENIFGSIKDKNSIEERLEVFEKIGEILR